MTADFQGSIAAKMLASQIGAGIRGNQPGSSPVKKGSTSGRGSDNRLSYGASKDKTASNPFGLNSKTMG